MPSRGPRRAVFSFGKTLDNFEISNDNTVFAVDGKCRISKLFSTKSPTNDWSGKHGIWRIIYSENGKIDELWADLSKSKVSLENGVIKAVFDGKFKVEISICINGNDIEYKAKIFNNSKEATITEFHFPMLKSANVGANARLVSASGAIISEIPVYMRGCKEELVRPEHKARLSLSQSHDAKNNFMRLENKIGALTFTSGELSDLFAIRCHNKNILDFFFVRRIELKYGESADFSKFSMSCK